MPANSAVSYSISQNFLTSAKIIHRLLARTTIGKSDRVIEIGAGKGHITRALVNVCREVVAYEIDPALCQSLRCTLVNQDALKLVQGDFLTARLPVRGAYKVFANIPFSITTAIVRKLTTAPNPPTDAWLVVEKGAAKRFVGTPRETATSLALKPFFDTNIVYHFARADFHPMPGVDCVLLHFAKKEQPDIDPCARAAFAAFVKGGARRFLSKKQIATALRLQNLAPLGPSSEMLYVQWLCLFRSSRRFCEKKIH